MKKLLTCLFTLLMAVAILSPVSMRAEVKNGTFNIRLSQLDRETGARLTATRGEFQYDTAYGYQDLATTYVDGENMNEWMDWENLLDFRSGSSASEYTSFVLYVYDANGRFVASLDSLKDGANYSSVQIRDGYTIEIALMVDKNTEYTTVGTGADGTDDRLQPVITVVKQHDVGSSLYDRPTSADYYVVNEGDDVAALLESGDIWNFTGWDDYTYVASTDKEYVRVYSEPLNKVTADIEVKADWAEDKAGLDRFAPAATNDKDTNGDGKVSCDEYYGTTGLEWSDKLNACVVSSTGDAVVTIPNTATK